MTTLVNMHLMTKSMVFGVINVHYSEDGNLVNIHLMMKSMVFGVINVHYSEDGNPSEYALNDEEYGIWSHKCSLQ